MSSGTETTPVASALIRGLSVASVSLALTVFVLLSDRGLDFTDESFYLLNFLYWQDLAATVTFFGALLDLPFRLSGGSLPLFRVFGLGLLIAASWYLTHSATAYFAACSVPRCNADRFSVAIIGISAGVLYYGFFGTLRTPSYNLLALVFMMVSTGIVSKYLSANADRASGFLAGTAYGSLVTLLVLTKATSAVAMVAVHAIVFFAHRGRSAPRAILPIVPGALLSVALVLGVFTLIQPNWWQVLSAGVELINSTDDRANLVVAALTHFRWDVQLYIANHYDVLGLLFLAHVLVLTGLGRRHGAVAQYWVMLIVLGLITLAATSAKDVSRLPPSLFVLFLLWTTELLLRSRLRLSWQDLAVIGIPVGLAVLSLAFSWGSNMTLLKHSNLAAAFPTIGVFLMLTRLRTVRIVEDREYRTLVLLMTIPALAVVARPWWDIDDTYRLNAPLSQHEHALVVSPGADPILVDEASRHKVDRFRELLKENGFQPGSGMLDLTGDAPGLVYTAGARPLGTVWLLGGYEGSSALVRKTIALVDKDQWRCAWLLTSEDSVRRIADWRRILEDADVFDHVEVGWLAIRPHSTWGGKKSERITIAIWRPQSARCAASRVAD